MKESASGGAEMNYPNPNSDFLYFPVTARMLRLVQHFKLDLCKNTMISRWKRCRHLVLIPAARAMPAFFPVLSALNQKQPGEMGREIMISPWAPACQQSVQPMLCGSPAPAAEQQSRKCHPTCPCALSASQWPLCRGVTAPLDPARCRCGRGVDVYRVSVHHLGQCSPRGGFTCLGFCNEWLGWLWDARRHLHRWVYVTALCRILERVFILDLKEGIFYPAPRFCEHD